MADGLVRFSFAALVILSSLISAVQFLDPSTSTPPPQVNFSERPEAYTTDAIERLRSVDHRTRLYRMSDESKDPSLDHERLRRPDREALRQIYWFDHTNKQYRSEYHGFEPPAVLYKSVDGVWEQQGNSSWTYSTWNERTSRFGGFDSFVLQLNETARTPTVTVIEETDRTVTVHVSKPLVESSHPNGSTQVTIEEATGDIRRVHQVTRFENTTHYKLLLIDEHGATDVSRPDDAPYSLETLVYDLLRGPIPLHRLL